MVDRSGHKAVLERPTILVQVVLWLAAEDGVGLAAASLAVRHDDAVEAIKDVLNHRTCDLLVRLGLSAPFVQHVIEVVVTGLVLFAHQGDTLVGVEVNLKTVNGGKSSLLLHLPGRLQSPCLQAKLLLKERPHSYDHSEVRLLALLSGL